jgi:DNA-binding NarL/FixJ family response regulator
LGDSNQAQLRFTVFLYNRYSLLIDAVESVLRNTGFAVVGKATVPERALQLVGAQRPDLLVAGLESSSGPREGLELIRRASAPPISLKVLVLYGTGAACTVEEVFAAGASALLDTAASREDIDFALRQTYSPSVHLPPPRVPAHEVPAATLTSRELQILRLAAEGYSNREVAVSLRITGQTVKFHLANVYRKLGVANRTQATRRAELLQLLELHA